MLLAHKIALDPNAAQRLYFARASGTATAQARAYQAPARSLIMRRSATALNRKLTAPMACSAPLLGERRKWAWTKHG
jgi:hypothetical protein